MFAKAGTRIPTIVPLLVLAGLSGGSAMGADQKRGTPPAMTSPASSSPTPGHTVKPSDVALPVDVPPGQYRRITQPFQNWTLICDENLVKKQKVCNITQTVVNAAGTTVFSWSLAASQDGQPFFILRTPPTVGQGRTIQLDLRDGGSVVAVPVKGCDATVCIAYQLVGPRLRAAVEKGLAVQVSYAAGSPPDTVSFRAPFQGLANALAAI
ncbi:hypothetical protein RHSP_64232 [Rhizobium freirei PRF 81]|uniref:Invasion associated locus B family protein n=1 Tax=Rhizobium freirei PRF 81 TaxID=363754 RepID=N6U8K0_9HYPH|nr:invasion associated locus B family protein [Rhizobium freirei]ENN86543.1 hypothetical protein RHSP_64232 [Rhizobium freirei PRF 81]